MSEEPAMPHALANQVVVITGASSGIGRATALELGRRGARVVLAARGEPALRETAHEVRRAGGDAQAVVTDVADWGQVEDLARAAVGHYGRIDTWVNNAAVIEYASVEQTTSEEAEQILRVNLLGVIHGSKAALAVMHRQGGGTVINVGSIESWFGVPYHAVYSASKHGVKGFTEALRRELRLERSPVQVVLVAPGATDTPLFDHARARLGGVKPMPLPPAYPPQEVARAIAFTCEHPRREIVVGGAGKFFTVLERASPALLDWVLWFNDMGKEGQRSDQPDTPGDNLAGPDAADTYRVRGSFDGISLGSSLYTRAVEQHPAVKAALFGAAVVGGLALLRGLARPAAPRPPRDAG
jgi:NAD(P)-dependent dehydrogenase (short-subunit alcohol dehydrogenase family)